MNEKLSPNPAETLALERFGLMTKIQDALAQQIPLAQALQLAASVPVRRADGSSRTFSVRTLEDWWYAYQKGGFARLHPQTRSDKGKMRNFTPEQEKAVLEQARSHPLVPLKLLYRQWKEKDSQLPSLSSVYRLLHQHQLGKKIRHALAKQNLSGPTKAFEVPFPNDLWMVDFSPGPYLHPPGSAKALSTQLCLLVDDHSRLVPFGAYYLEANTQAFHHAFKEALRRRGLPSKLYTDQGSVFTCDHTKIICANLGVRLLHAKPYHAWSKGKVERLFRTIQQDFEAGLRLPGQAAHSLEELNSKFSRWLQEIYHVREHSSTRQAPEVRFQQHSHQVRLLDAAQDLDRLFYTKIHRVVRKDGTVRLGNQLYEVDLSLRLLKVELRFDPYRLDRIEVYFRQQAFSLARRADLHFNSQLDARQQYEER
jgi:transposase InsO family protein